MPTGNPPKQPWQTSLSEAAARVEQELRNLVRTVDDDVVPEVRRHGSSALRTLSEQINRLAQHMDDARKNSSPPEDKP